MWQMEDFSKIKIIQGFHKSRGNKSPHIWGSNLHLSLQRTQWNIHLSTTTSMSSGFHKLVELILIISVVNEMEIKGDYLT